MADVPDGLYLPPVGLRTLWRMSDSSTTVPSTSTGRRRAVITAGTAGIGFATARELVHAGFAVTLIGRDADRGTRAVAELRSIGDDVDVRFESVELSSLPAVRELGRRLAAEGALHLLVNNVGGMYATRWTSPEGLEASFVLNHLTPIVLTEALIDALAAAAPSRLVQVTSGAILAAVPDFGGVEVPGEHYGLAVTGRAKLANLSWALEVADRLHERGITLVVADPGRRPRPTPRPWRRGCCRRRCGRCGRRWRRG